jgi:hypothetical protein
VFVDETNYNFYIFSRVTLMPGQRHESATELTTKYTYIPASTYQTINLGFSEENPFNSNEIRISELGIHDICMSKNAALYEFSVKVHFHCLDSTANIYSYVLIAEPKYIIINDTSANLELAQENAEPNEPLKPGARLNWVWPASGEPKNIMLRMVENEVEVEGMRWSFSAPLKITKEDFQECVIVLRP